MLTQSERETRVLIVPDPSDPAAIKLYTPRVVPVTSLQLYVKFTTKVCSWKRSLVSKRSLCHFRDRKRNSVGLYTAVTTRHEHYATNTYYKCCKRSHQALFHNLWYSAKFFFIDALENTEVEIYNGQVDNKKPASQTEYKYRYHSITRSVIHQQLTLL